MIGLESCRGKPGTVEYKREKGGQGRTEKKAEGRCDQRTPLKYFSIIYVMQKSNSNKKRKTRLIEKRAILEAIGNLRNVMHI